MLGRDDLVRYRAAFDGPLACAEGWIKARGPLLPAERQPSAQGLLGYYREKHLRPPAAQRDRCC